MSRQQDSSVLCIDLIGGVADDIFCRHQASQTDLLPETLVAGQLPPPTSAVWGLIVIDNEGGV